MSELIKKQKEEQVNALAEKFSKAKGIVLVDYRGMTVAEDTALRNELRKENVEYKVIKNRIMLRAFDKVGYKGLDEVLQGTTAVAISYEDPVVPAKILSDNARPKQLCSVSSSDCSLRPCARSRSQSAKSQRKTLDFKAVQSNSRLKTA